MESILNALRPFMSLDFDIITHLRVIFEKGGVMMYPLTLCSLIVVFVTLERLFALRQTPLVSEQQFLEWANWFKGDKTEPSPQPNSSPSILNAILSSLVGVLPLSHARLDERIGDLARREKHRLERGLVYLDTIAGIAPLFGLLGTAIGMVEVFARLSAAGDAKMSALSSGISQALFTTVAGLCIGIPALIAYNLFSRRIERILILAENQLNTLIDEHYSQIVTP